MSVWWRTKRCGGGDLFVGGRELSIIHTYIRTQKGSDTEEDGPMDGEMN